MDFDWQNFSAFEGTLSTDLLLSTTIEEATEKFQSWLNGLLTTPADYGVPQSHVGSIDTIRQRFAVYDGNGKIGLKPTLERTNAITQDIEPDPVTIHFGFPQQALEVVDSAAALGYIFSIVKRPSHANWYDYWLPLLVLYSKCLYLAFLFNHADENTAITGIPIMASVVYLAHGADFPSSDRPAMFGASIPSAPLFGNQPGDTIARARTWRRGKLLLPALQRVAGTEAKLPLAEPDLRKLVDALHTLITKCPPKIKKNQPTPPPDLIPERRPLQDDLFELNVQITEDVKSRIDNGEPLSFLRLGHAEATKETLRALLSGLFIRRYNVSGAPETDAELNDLFKKVLEFYISPHVYPYRSVKISSDEEVPLLDSEKDEVTRIVLTLWADPSFKAKAFDKLEYVIKRQEVYNDPKSQSDSGKCAETYPVVGVGHHYFPSSGNHMQHIRGFAMEIRNIGNTTVFLEDGFSLSSLRKVRGTRFKTCSRYPCKNCRAVLTLFGVPARLDGGLPAAYDRDLDAADLQPW